MPWQKIKVQDPQCPASSIQFRILGSQGLASSICTFQDPGFPGSHVQYTLQDPRFSRSHVRYTFQDPGFPRSHDKYKFQDPESSRSHNLESPRSHKHTFQDLESPRSHGQVGMHCRIQCSQGPTSSWHTTYDLPPPTYHLKHTAYKL